MDILHTVLHTFPVQSFQKRGFFLEFFIWFTREGELEGSR